MQKEEMKVENNDEQKTQEKFTVYFEQKEFNIKTFIEKHPGGRDVLLKSEGQDITESFNAIGHSAAARVLLNRYLVEKDVAKVEQLSVKAKQREDLSKYGLKFTTKKLFTEEDKYFIHKTFGILSLLSYVYRYFYVLPMTGTLGFQEQSILNYATIAVHFFLSFSSLIFHVLEKRIVANPLIIYEEYRLHAILFTARALLVTLVGMNRHLLPESMVEVCLVGSILGVHLLVDYVTAIHGTPGVTAVRNTNDGSLKELRLFYAFYQFLALGTHLILDPTTCDLGFNAVVAIQSSAFLMTLKRKSLIRWYSHAFWYTLALALSIIYMYIAKGPVFFMYVLGAFFIRVKLNLNKYLIWAMFITFIHLNNAEPGSYGAKLLEGFNPLNFVFVASQPLE